jgi:stealth protein CR2/Stealth-like protein
MTEDVDAVYTWVDGSDPGFQAMRRHYAGPAPADQANRYRSNGELRFSLRSLLRHAPWVRRVHILTNGQVPGWLDRSHPRIHVVTHAEVFPKPQCLPTFNSHAIEMCLHRIPGLSRRFLYLNDDFFLGRDVRPAEFFTPDGGQMVFVDDFPLMCDPRQGSARERACAFTQNLLTERWGTPAGARLLPSHAPQAYDRDLLFRLESLFQDEFRATRGHRFRSGNDLALNVLYGYTLLESAAERGLHQIRVLPDRSRQYRFFILEHRYLRTFHHYVKILWQRPCFLCINDDLGDVPRRHPLLLSLRAFLPLYYWWRAPWERNPFRAKHQTFSPHPPSQ